MERVGERLRRRREELGFTIEDIARVTKYRPDTIRAVEEGRGGVFPADAYRQAFLRAYAERLGLDPAEIARDQRSEEERIQEALKGIRVRPRRSERLRRLLVWLVVIVAVAAALLVLYDRVIKVGGLSGRVEEPLPTQAGAVDSAETAPPGSMRVVPPADSVGGALEAGESRSGGEEAPVSTGEEERTGGSSSAPETGSTGTDDTSAEPPVEEGAVTAAVDAEPAEARAATAEHNAVQSTSGRAPDRLVVLVGDYAVRARLFAGDSLLVNGWLHAGFRDTFFSNAPFWADTIVTESDAMLLVFNGERVDLPSDQGNVITDFRISP
jgi:cytoskeleton protein RodZ